MSYYVKITQNTNRIIELIETQVKEKTSGNHVAYHAEISPPNPLSDSSKLIDSGYKFRFEDLEDCFRHLLGKRTVEDLQ